MATRIISLSSKLIEELRQSIDKLSNGVMTVEVKTVKAGTYDAVIPVDDLGLQKGEKFLAVYLGGKIWLLIPAELLEKNEQ